MQGALPPDDFANLVAMILGDDNLSYKEKKGLIAKIQEANPLRSRRLYMVVVGALSTVVLVTVIAGFLLVTLAKADPEVPASLVGLGSTALGALAGLLAPSPRGG